MKKIKNKKLVTVVDQLKESEKNYQLLNIKTLVNPVDFEESPFQLKINLSEESGYLTSKLKKDVEINIIPRKQHILNNGIPINIQNIYDENLLAKLCVEFYTSQWVVTCYRDLSYNGLFWSLPNIHKEMFNVKEQRFLIDDEKYKDTDNSFNFKDKGIYLESELAVCSLDDYQMYIKDKAGEIFDNNAQGSGNKKYSRPTMVQFSISELSDGTKVLRESVSRDGYVQEIIYLDVVDKINKIDDCWINLSFKIKQKPAYLYTGNKEHQELWLQNLTDAINTTSVKGDGSAMNETIERTEDTIQEMLLKILQETDQSAATIRKEDHQNLLTISPDIVGLIKKKSNFPTTDDLKLQEKSVLDDGMIRPQVEQIYPRKYFKLTGKMFLTSIKYSPENNSKKDTKTLPEPFFISCCLVNVTDNRRISEEFQWNPNHPTIENLLSKELFCNKWVPRQHLDEDESSLSNKTPLDLPTFPNHALQNCKSFIVKTPFQQQQVGVLIRIDKVFNGMLSSWVEKYVKYAGMSTIKKDGVQEILLLDSSNNKSGQSIHKTMSAFCSNIGHYRMPFCWSFCALNSIGEKTLPLYRYEGNKYSDEDLFKLIHGPNFNSPNRVAIIPGYIKLFVEEMAEDTINNLSDVVNSDLICKKKSNPSHDSVCSKEIKEFIFDPLRTNISSQPSSSQLKHGSVIDSTSLANMTRPTSDYGASGTVDGADENSCEDLTPSGDVYNSFFFPNAVNHNNQTDSVLGVKNNDEKSQQISVNQEDLIVPFLDFTHSLYVYPRTLNFSNQSIFHRARNLSCFVELRNSDSPEFSVPLKVIYSRPSNKQPAFDTWANTSVIYHDTCPSFNEEIKMSLPVNITAKHHILFRFYHVSIDTASTISSKDKASTKKTIEAPVGFAWLPLLNKDLNLNSGTFNLPIAKELTPNYLEGGNRMGLIQWVDGQRPLFSVVLRPDSTIYTQNVHLHKFFRICSEKLPTMLTKESERNNGSTPRSNDALSEDMLSTTITINNAMKVLVSVDVTNLILFLGPTFNQLFSIIVKTSIMYPRIGQTAVTTIINLSSTLRGQSLEVLSSRAIRRNTTILKNYIKYSFDSDKIVSDSSTTTVHDSLVQTLSELISPTFRDMNFIHSFLQNAFLLYSVIVKSMIQSSMKRDKIKSDHEDTNSFATTFTSHLESLIHLIVSCILEVSSNNSNHQIFGGSSRGNSVSAQSLALSANKDLARFIARLFNVMDRGFIFRGIYQYMKVVDLRMKSHSVDNDQLIKMKFEFLEIICQHEHFIALNLTETENQINKESLTLERSLSESFCHEHYLIGLVLLQIHQQMSNTFSSNATRRLPFILLRNLFAKHSLDDRYKLDIEQYKIARLYLPLISIILENQKSLSMPGASSNKALNANNHDGSDKSASSRQFSLSGDTLSTHSSIDGSESGGGSIYGVGTGAGVINNKTVRSSQAYLNKEGRVDSHFLNMIAGLTTEGKLRGLSGRRQVESDTSSINSTCTLTGLDEFDEAENSSLSDEMVIHTQIDLKVVADSSSRRGSIHNSMFSESSSVGKRTGMQQTHNPKGNATAGYSNLRQSSGMGVIAGLNKSLEPKSLLWLNDKTQKDVFLCLIHLFNTLSSDDMKYIIGHLMSQERLDFLQLLIYAIHHLKYQGKNSIFDFESISTSDIKPGHGQALLRNKAHRMKPARTAEESNEQNLAALDGNVSTEVGLVVLDVLSMYCLIYKQEIITNGRDHVLFRRIIDVFFALLSVNQSDTVLKHTLVSMRIFVATFSKILFSSCHSIICDLSLHVLRYCDCRSPGVRSEACGFLYRMMRSSYESFNKEGLNGVHLQMIVAVSKLDRTVGRRFNQSLTYLREVAEFEMKKEQLKPTIKPKPLSRMTSSLIGPIYKMDMRYFFEGVSELTQRIRTVLMATMKMNVHKDDPEMLVDLQYSLAKTYSSNPALRRTWLEKIYTVHEKNNAKAEMAMCKAHIVAMICECLKRKELYSIGCADFEIISPNIANEERTLCNDSAKLEVHYSKDEVIVLLKEVAQAFDVAGLWEMLRHIYGLIMPIYEKKRDYEQLEHIYEHLASGCKKIKNSDGNNQRLIGSYYQVVFYGKPFENLAGKSFVYRLDSGKQFCVAREELQVLFGKKFGRDKVNMLTENYVDRDTLDPNLASIHVIHVNPFFDDDEELLRQSMFERQYNISRFMLEVPFMKESHVDINDIVKSKQTDDLSIQWKRRTILTVEASFPHLKRRLEVVNTKEIDFSPIERAVDEIKSKNRELITDLMFSKQSSTPNKLSNNGNSDGNINLLMDMHLAGALLPQVNQGPMAYARVFLQKENQLVYPPDQVTQLKVEFMQFLSLCSLLLVKYNELMARIHEPKYWAMQNALDKYRIELSNLLNEEITMDQEKMVICSQQLSEQVQRHLSKRLGTDEDMGTHEQL